MADLHNDVMYEGWTGKTSAAGHRACMGNSKHVLKSQKIHPFATRKIDRLHALRIATQRGGVIISEANGHIGIRCEALIA